MNTLLIIALCCAVILAAIFIIPAVIFANKHSADTRLISSLKKQLQDWVNLNQEWVKKKAELLGNAELVKENGEKIAAQNDQLKMQLKGAQQELENFERFHKENMAKAAADYLAEKNRADAAEHLNKQVNRNLKDAVTALQEAEKIAANKKWNERSRKKQATQVRNLAAIALQKLQLPVENYVPRQLPSPLTDVELPSVEAHVIDLSGKDPVQRLEAISEFFKNLVAQRRASEENGSNAGSGCQAVTSDSCCDQKPCVGPRPAQPLSSDEQKAQTLMH